MRASEETQRTQVEPSLLLTRELVLTGLCVALALGLPFVFHLVPQGGPIFLPMFLPILLLGLLVRPSLALLGALLAPPLSALLTGMPPWLPTAPLMMVEMGTLAVVAALLRDRLPRYPWAVALLAWICGRLAAGLVVWSGGALLGMAKPALAWLAASTVMSLPGVALLVLLVPTLAYAINRRSLLQGAR